MQSPAAKDEGLKQDDVDRVLRDASRALSAASESLGESVAKPTAQQPEQGSEGPQGFERPQPVTLADLDAIKRVALFG